MIIGKNYTITNNSFLQPSYRISPFRTSDLIKNANFENLYTINNYLKEKFEDKIYYYTSSGRKALSIVLQEFKLSNSDYVTIFTTSSNHYISSCVTNEIEKICKWSRKVEDKTKVILVNHEFGFPYEKLSKILDYNIPIIEDCAHSFFSQNSEKSVGKIGDYIIYSLPKIFPIQFGGIIKVNKKDSYLKSDLLEEEELYIKKVLSHCICDINNIIDKRIRNYYYLENELSVLNLSSRFDLKASYCPGVYLFKMPYLDLGNLNGLKIFMQDHGVECSVFYGECSFFIPINQNLEFSDLDYFVELIKYYLRSISNEEKNV